MRTYAQSAVRHRREYLDDALKLLTRVNQAVEAHVDVTESDGRGVISWLQPARRRQRLGRVLQPPGLLLEDAEQMRPLAVS